MKLSIALVILPAVAAFAPKSIPPMRNQVVLEAALIMYDSQTGNTETCATYISNAASDAKSGYLGDFTDDDIKSADCLIVGAPTWHTDSEVERSGTSWDEWLYQTLPGLGLEGKKVAIFGCGDSQSYSDYYCDAAGELYDCFTKAGCKIFGKTSTDGYDHQASKAEIDGQFIGAMFDEDNQYDLSEGRATAWVTQLKGEGFF